MCIYMQWLCVLYRVVDAWGSVWRYFYYFATPHVANWKAQKNRKLPQIAKRRRVLLLLLFFFSVLRFFFGCFSWSQLNVLFLSTTKVFINLSIYISIYSSIYSSHSFIAPTSKFFLYGKLHYFHELKKWKNNHYIFHITFYKMIYFYCIFCNHRNLLIWIINQKFQI